MMLRGLYLLTARKVHRRRKTPTVARRVCDGWVEMAGWVLWLELRGYSCRVSRLKL